MNIGPVAQLVPLLQQVTGFIFPNELEVHWALLIVLYPYITGVVAGAFILASLVKVFNVKEVQPTYRLSLLTALSFLLVAPLPLLLHLGHPFRSYEIFLTPNFTSAMAMFGFVYAWYLMVVLLLEIWFDYRRDLVIWSNQEKGLMRVVYRVLSLFTKDIGDSAVKLDKKAVKIITIIGIPSAFMLHGYVGFIFGSIKANPWWSSVLMPIVFLFSAIVSGIAMVLMLYMIITPMRGKAIDMSCLDRVASYLFYAVIVDFSLEFLDFIHRLYESEESIKILSDLVSKQLFGSLVIIQVILGMLIPLTLMSVIKIFKFDQELRRLLYFVSAILIQVGIFTTRWNVVVGGQMFSKSMRGLISFNMHLWGLEGLFTAILLLVLPFVILFFLLKIFPPWGKETGTPDKPVHEMPAECSPQI